MENKETARLEMFSDGVFAIAITLLILEIKVPHISSIHSNEDLWQELGKLWPSYFAFILTFGFILISWICHHALFNLLHKSSPQLIYANGLLLLNIVFLPFPTAMLAEYVMSDYAQPAVEFYCICFLFTGISWNLLYHYTIKPVSLVKEKVFIDEVKTMQKYARFGLIVNTFIVVLAWWFPLTALIINSVLWLFWIRTSAAMLSPKRHIQ